MKEKVLERFLVAQEGVFETALEEVGNGCKETHWMWFIFPQLEGLGISHMAQYYGIQNKQEAIDYINHPVLGKRLIRISKELLKLYSNDARKVMGYPDNLKLCSCMTLFAEIAPNEKVFQKVLDKFFNGEKDEKTIELLKNM